MENINKEKADISIVSLERLLSLGLDALGLYILYYLTAKRQAKIIGYENLTIKATTVYCSVGLNISEARVRMAKKILTENGFIESVVRRSRQRILGHYIKINYVENILYPYDSLRVENSNVRDFYPLSSLPLENHETNTCNKKLNTCNKKLKGDTFDENISKDIKLEQNTTEIEQNSNKLYNSKSKGIKESQKTGLAYYHSPLQRKPFSTQDDTLLKKDDLDALEQAKHKDILNISGAIGKPKSISKQNDTLLNSPIVCEHGNQEQSCSKCGRHACTEAELWEIAEKTNVKLDFIVDKHGQILDMIENGEFNKKYKTVFNTLRNWVTMARDDRRAQEMSEIERAIFLKNSPEEAKKKKELIQLAIQEGVL